MQPSLLRRRLTPYAFLLPGMLVVALWLAYPMLRALQISLHDWSPMPGGANPFVGLGNYARALQDPLFWTALKNTALYALVTVGGQMMLGLLVALALDRVAHGQVVLRALYYLPVVTSWVVVSLLFKYLFNSSPSGLVNYLLVDVLHLVPTAVPWLNYPQTAFVPIYCLGIWKGVGWTMVIFLAALQAIPDEYYEAAAMDGAGAWQTLRWLTLPLLVPTAVLTLIMLTIGAFQAYIQVALITGGAPMHRTEVLLSYMYYQAFTQQEFGYAGALSFTLVGIVFAISQWQLRALRGEAGS